MQACIQSALEIRNADLSQQIGYAFQSAIQEALLYVGRTAPNPPVGCAILDKNGAILTVAAHHQAGTLHAEALALQQCRDLGVWDQIAEVIVTLEPCNHTGRTAPCSQALLDSPAKRIWIGTRDPNPQVCGAGGAALCHGGKEVVFLETLPFPEAEYWFAQCQALVAPFIQNVTQRKAWLTVKQALNSVGSMIPAKGQKTFTSQNSLMLAHKLRRGTEAIVTGPSTIKADWPSFTVRHVPDHPYRKRLLVVCSRQATQIQEAVPVQYLIEAQNNGFSVTLCRDIRELPAFLAEHGVIWGMVEGGPQLLQGIRQAQIWDEWLTFRKPAQDTSIQGEDSIKLVSRHGVSPARQLLFHSDLVAASRYKKELSCSLGS